MKYSICEMNALREEMKIKSHGSQTEYRLPQYNV